MCFFAFHTSKVVKYILVIAEIKENHDMEKGAPSCAVDENAKWYKPLWKTV